MNSLPHNSRLQRSCSGQSHPECPPNSPYFGRNQDGSWDFIIKDTRRPIEGFIQDEYREIIADLARVGWIDFAAVANIDVPLSSGTATVAAMIAWDNVALWSEWKTTPRMFYNSASFPLVKP